MSSTARRPLARRHRKSASYRQPSPTQDVHLAPDPRREEVVGPMLLTVRRREAGGELAGGDVDVRRVGKCPDHLVCASCAATCPSGSDDVLALPEDDAFENAGPEWALGSRLRAERGAVDDELHRVGVTVDPDVGRGVRAIGVAPTDDVRDRLGAPVRLVEVERVFAGLAVERDQPLVLTPRRSPSLRMPDPKSNMAQTYVPQTNDERRAPRSCARVRRPRTPRAGTRAHWACRSARAARERVVGVIAERGASTVLADAHR